MPAGLGQLRHLAAQHAALQAAADARAAVAPLTAPATAPAAAGAHAHPSGSRVDGARVLAAAVAAAGTAVEQTALTEGLARAASVPNPLALGPSSGGTPLAKAVPECPAAAGHAAGPTAAAGASRRQLGWPPAIEPTRTPAGRPPESRRGAWGHAGDALGDLDHHESLCAPDSRV